jgi:hypothetical protein
MLVQAERWGCVIAVRSFRQVCLRPKLSPAVQTFRVSQEEVDFRVLPSSLLYQKAGDYVLVAARRIRPANMYTTVSCRKYMKETYEKASAVSNCEHCNVALPDSDRSFSNEATSVR